MIAGRNNLPTPESASQVLIVKGTADECERMAFIINAEADLRTCGVARNCQEALALVEETQPDIVLTGLRLERSHGLDLIKELRIRSPRMPVLTVSPFDSSFYAERAIRAGARGFVPERQAPQVLAQAIRCVLKGQVYLNSSLARSVAAQLADRARTNRFGGMHSLTDRELEVFELVGHGFDSRQIAERMGLRVSTVNTHRARIKMKLQVHGSSELLKRAILWAHRSGSTVQEATPL